MKLSKAIAVFISEMRATGKAAATCTAYESDLRRLAANAKVDSVLMFTKELVSNHLLVLSGIDNLKMSTLHRKRACFGQFAKWGVKERLWTANPIDTLDTIRRPKHLPRPFSTAEADALLALDLTPQEIVVRALLFYTGLRVTPLCGIKVGDISYEPPTIRVIVKGAKQQVIQMHPVLARLLYDYALQHTNLKGHTFLLTKRGGSPFHRRDVERMTQRWGRAAGVANCTPHRFRHTFATGLLQAGVDIRVIQEAMGHEDISSTMIYTEVTDQAVAAGIGKLRWGRG